MSGLSFIGKFYHTMSGEAWKQEFWGVQIEKPHHLAMSGLVFFIITCFFGSPAVLF